VLYRQSIHQVTNHTDFFFCWLYIQLQKEATLTLQKKIPEVGIPP
jgi:hypothetical protein